MGRNYKIYFTQFIKRFISISYFSKFSYKSEIKKTILKDIFKNSARFIIIFSLKTKTKYRIII